MKNLSTLIVLPLVLLSFICSAHAQEETTEVAYVNPVGGDILMGDPFIARYGDTYYLTGTTAAGSGFHMWTSTNLVDWEPLGMVFEGDEWAETNFWAPELFEYQGQYYLAYSAYQEEVGYRLALAVADQPEGPYDELYIPWFDLGINNIDASVFIDDDGTPYVYFSQKGLTSGLDPRYRFGAENWGAQLSEDLSEIVGEPQRVTTPEQEWEIQFRAPAWVDEGPFVFEHEGTYYMTYASGNYRHPSYAIGYATASHPLGPWTKRDNNPIVALVPEMRISGPGHCNITVAPDGETLVMVYHVHADYDEPSAERLVFIDLLAFDEVDNGPPQMRVKGPTITPQILPGATGPAHDYFAEAAYSGGNRWTTGALGLIEDAGDFPYVMLMEQGVQAYVAGPSPDNLWYWDPELGWMWTSDEVAPYDYRYESGGFIYYLEGTHDPRWFFDFGAEAWQRFPAEE